jgi:hypothetical protein
MAAATREKRGSAGGSMVGIELDGATTGAASCGEVSELDGTIWLSPWSATTGAGSSSSRAMSVSPHASMGASSSRDRARVTAAATRAAAAAISGEGSASSPGAASGRGSRESSAAMT